MLYLKVYPIRFVFIDAGVFSWTRIVSKACPFLCVHTTIVCWIRVQLLCTCFNEMSPSSVYSHCVHGCQIRGPIVEVIKVEI